MRSPEHSASFGQRWTEQERSFLRLVYCALLADLQRKRLIRQEQLETTLFSWHITGIMGNGDTLRW